jgi:ABC-type transport system substrate-binding protein
VEAGRSNIKEVTDWRKFYNNESVRVVNDGKGKINFNDGSTITLYNNTITDQVTAKFNPAEIGLYLSNQGFEGYVPQGSSFTVDMPNGSNVKILGTQFFVVYDPDTSYSIVGNFDGTVLFTPPGGSEQSLSPSTMVDMAPDGSVNFLELPYGPTSFDESADRFGSPMNGIRVLRDEFEQPQPGWIATAEPIATEPPAKPITTVFRHLVIKEGDSYLPDLAESWETDPDGYLIVFHLRPGVYLPNGDPFTSSTVEERLMADWQYARDGNVEFERIDDYTLRMYLSGPDVYYVLDQMSIFEFEVQLG